VTAEPAERKHAPPGTWQHGPASGIPASGIPASGVPARGTTRPPFPDGNTLSTTHGARSPRVYGELARMLAAGLMEDRPDLARYPEAVARWAEAEAQAALLRRHLAEVGTIDPETNSPRAGSLTWLRSFERAAAEAGALLGLDPMSEAKLSRERAAASVLAVDLEAVMARGREAIASREAQGLPAPPDLAGEVLARVKAAGALALATTTTEEDTGHDDD